MSKVLDEVLAANDTYVAGFGDKGSLTLPPAGRFAILTCMDARLDPAKFAGLTEGDAHVIRRTLMRSAVTQSCLRAALEKEPCVGAKIRSLLLPFS